MKPLLFRERLLAASRGRMADRLPYFHYWRHSQIGWAERECRNRGMGMNWTRPSYTVTVHGVKVIEEQATVSGRSIVRRTYQTPVGSVYEDIKREPGTGQWHAQRSWTDVSPATTDHLIKEPDDYRVATYMVEHTEYEEDFYPLEQAIEWLGEDGLVLDAIPHSPMQTLLLDWIGTRGGRFYYHLADYPDLVEGLYQALCKSYSALYEITSRAPTPITLYADNVDGFLVTPPIYEDYFLPEYVKLADMLHRRSKLLAVHMDGRLAVLRDLISRTPIDVVEAFHPPPMGDLKLSEALKAWPEKIIWIGFPGAVYELGPAATAEYARELLSDAGTGERLALAMSTENLVSNENLLAATSVLEKALLPLDHGCANRSKRDRDDLVR